MKTPPSNDTTHAHTPTFSHSQVLPHNLAQSHILTQHTYTLTHSYSLILSCTLTLHISTVTHPCTLTTSCAFTHTCTFHSLTLARTHSQATSTRSPSHTLSHTSFPDRSAVTLTLVLCGSRPLSLSLSPSCPQCPFKTSQSLPHLPTSSRALRIPPRPPTCLFLPPRSPHSLTLTSHHATLPPAPASPAPLALLILRLSTSFPPPGSAQFLLPGSPSSLPGTHRPRQEGCSEHQELTSGPKTTPGGQGQRGPGPAGAYTEEGPRLLNLLI